MLLGVGKLKLISPAVADARGLTALVPASLQAGSACTQVSAT